MLSVAGTTDLLCVLAKNWTGVNSQANVLVPVFVIVAYTALCPSVHLNKLLHRIVKGKPGKQKRTTVGFVQGILWQMVNLRIFLKISHHFSILIQCSSCG